MSVDEHTIELAGSPLFYRRAPSTDVPVVYLHGIPTSSDDWIPFLERTGGIAPDLIGFGRSGKGGHLEYTPESQARFLEALLRTLDVQRLSLVVHDWGAVPGLVLAQQDPARIERLVVLNATPVFDAFHWPRAVRLLRRRGLGELIMGATTKRVLARTLRQGGQFPRSRLQSTYDQFDQGTQRAILRLYRDADETRLAALGAKLNTLKMPALVLWGERDPWLAPELGDSYARRLPMARLERHPDAGHWPWLEGPAVIERVAEFLTQT